MRSLEMALLELRRLFSHRLLRVALLVLCIVPLLYGVLYLWAFWNPYSRLDKVPVAVVNLDKTATANGVTVHAGADLVSVLRENRVLDWRFVSAAQARKGLTDGSYYISLTVPRNFSARLARANGTRAKPGVLIERAHESSNLLASQLGGNALKQVRRIVSATISKRYVAQILERVNSIRSGLAQAGAASGKLAAGLKSGGAGAATLATGLHSARSGSSTLAGGLSTLAGGTAAVSRGAGSVASGAGSLSSGLGSAQSGAATLASGSAALAKGTQQLSTGLETLTSQSSQLTSGAAQLAAGAAQIATGTGQAVTQMAQATGSATQLAAAAGNVAAALKAYAAAHPDAAADATFAAALGGATEVAGGSSQLAAGLQSASSQGQQLAAGAQSLSSSATALSSGIVAYAGGVDSAGAAAQKLSGGAGSVSSGAATLARGVTSARTGAARLASGAASVAAGTAGLSSGAGKAAGAAASLAGGIAQLSAGGDRLSAGIAKAAAGGATLHQVLAAGVVQVPSFTAAHRRVSSAVMSDPVRLSVARVDPVPDYGTGFAPYFIPLALWVGALMTYFVIRPLTPRALSSTLRSPWVALSGLWAGLAVTTVQAIVMMAVLQLALGLDPVRPVLTYLFCILAALTFAAILQFLSAALGTAGKFVAVVLLMLQLTSAAGTFPLQTVPRFFQIINPVLPMTYVVAGLRETISGGNLALIAWNSLVLCLFAAVAFAGTVITAQRRRDWTPARLHQLASL